MSCRSRSNLSREGVVIMMRDNRDAYSKMVMCATRHALRCFFLCASLMLLACSQPPAPVQYEGNRFFGREHEAALDSPEHETYPADSERYKEGYARPAEAAPAPVVAVADLPPPLARAEPVVVPPEPKAASPVADAANHGRFIWPVTGGKIVSRFGPKPDGKANDGINIALAEGVPILASADGVVVYAGNDLKDYGNMIILRHEGGWMTAYAHAREIAVKKNDYVKQGELIGYVGMTGGVKSPQLHFALRNGKTPVDPEQYLPHTVAGMQ